MKTVKTAIIRITYKSGHVHDFECIKFSINPGKEASWEAFDPTPLVLGLDEIESVWVIGRKTRIVWGKP